MRTVLASLAGVFLSAGFTPGEPGKDDQPKAPASARVVIVGTVSGFSRDGKDLEYRLQAPAGKDMIAGAVYVRVPAAKVKDEVPARKPVAFEGRLTTKDVQVGSTGSIPPRPILAKAAYLIADKYTVIDDKNRKTFPAAGAAGVRGQALHGKFPLSAKTSSSLAIENGNQPIALTGKGLEALKNIDALKGVLRAEGKLRVGDRGALILDADRIEVQTKDSDARTQAARAAAIAYAKASNLETGRVAAVMKLAAVPFFPGVVGFGGSGVRVPIYAPVLKDDVELRKWLGPQLGHIQAPHKLALDVRRVQTYADFRRKHLVEAPAAGVLGDLNERLQAAARQALDDSVGKDGLIVFLGAKSGVGEGILIRFENGVAKVAGMLGNTNPELGSFSIVRPPREKGK